MPAQIDVAVRAVCQIPPEVIRTVAGQLKVLDVMLMPRMPTFGTKGCPIFADHVTPDNEPSNL
ncbi:hypothetical protein D3C75_998680 [compost metagenome]